MSDTGIMFKFTPIPVGYWEGYIVWLCCKVLAGEKVEEHPETMEEVHDAITKAGDTTFIRIPDTVLCIEISNLEDAKELEEALLKASLP